MNIEPPDHNYTAKTKVTFHAEKTRGTCETEQHELGDFLTPGNIEWMHKDAIEKVVADAFGEWLCSLLMDNACYEIG